MNPNLLLSLTVLFLLPSLLWGTEKISTFTHSVQTDKKPWTEKEFINNPKDFQFAIVSDRTGGPREGVFPRAVDKLNELRPEFVITVGDLIQGGAGNRDVQKLKGQWKEFNSFIEGSICLSFTCRATMTWVMRWQIKSGTRCSECVTIPLSMRMFCFCA